jgi:hypothetical protein
MSVRLTGLLQPFLICIALPASLHAQVPPQSPQSSSTKLVQPPADSALDPGAIVNGVYRNKTLALSCKIPPGWVLRTDDMNARQEKDAADPASATGPSASSAGKVLLAAFSRPPQAKAEEVNSSILIAAESASSYPGLKDPAQYFGPLTEVAKAQGFTVDEQPYEFALGTKKLVRGDFHKDVGTRRILQSSLVMLSHGCAVSITMIGGTEDEVEELIDGLTFSAVGK